MATDHHSWTVTVSRAELPIDSRDWVVYELPDAVSNAMGRDDAFYTASRRDRLHYSLRALIQAFGATSLAFLDRGAPPKPDDKAADGTVCEGFVVSALIPEDVPAALAEIDEMLPTRIACRRPRSSVRSATTSSPSGVRKLTTANTTTTSSDSW